MQHELARCADSECATLNIAVVIALFLTPWYAPPIAFISSAVLIFVGASMWLAAIRGYGGCELLAVSNWVLHRDDQLGCLVLSPMDAAERSFRSGRSRQIAADWRRTFRSSASVGAPSGPASVR